MKAEQKSPTYKKPLIIIAILLLVGLVSILIYTLLESPYRQRLDTVRSELEMVQQETIETAGGVSHSGPTYNRESFFNIFGCVDINCPSATQEWLVPIEKDKEDAFADKILRVANYTRHDEFGHFGDKNDLHIMVVTNPIGSFPPPAEISQDKAWYFVRVTIYE